MSKKLALRCAARPAALPSCVRPGSPAGRAPAAAAGSPPSAGRAPRRWPPCGPLRGACGPPIVTAHGVGPAVGTAARAGSVIVRGAGSSGAAALEPRRRQPATPPETGGAQIERAAPRPRCLVRGRRPRWAGSRTERPTPSRRNAPGIGCLFFRRWRCGRAALASRRAHRPGRKLA